MLQGVRRVREKDTCMQNAKYELWPIFYNNTVGR